MIDWLRWASEDPVIEVGGCALPIAIRRHARAKRLTMRLAPDGSEVRITLPTWGRAQDALVFASARQDWLAQQLARVPQARPVDAGGTLPYRGRELRIEWHEAAPRKPVLGELALRLGGPRGSIQPRLQRWLESEALRLMLEDLVFYCERAGQAVPELKLSRAQRRWGSCSSHGAKERRIRINWRLVQAPDHVRRSVVAHEVAHLEHFDHSPAFHALLGELYESDLAAADRWLKDQGRALYAPFG